MGDNIHELTITMCGINKNITLATGTHIGTIGVVTIVLTTSILQFTLIHIWGLAGKSYESTISKY